MAVRPLTVFAVLTLFANDHLFKHLWPGFVTGKLSDVAGMIFFPLLAQGLVWMFVPRSQRADRNHDRLLLALCVATAIVFTLTKTSVLANDAYRITWGVMQWPWRAVRALVHGTALPHVARVVLVRDPSDVLAVPFVLVAWLYGRRAHAATTDSPLEAPSEALSRL